jgi:hypothetical protein
MVILPLDRVLFEEIQMLEVPGEAVEGLRAFLDASDRQDMEAMSARVTRQTLASGKLHGPPMQVRYELGEGRMESAAAVIPVSGFPKDAPKGAAPEMLMDCVMVREDGLWKLDLPETMQRMLGGKLDSAVQQVADGLGRAMEQMGKAVATALGGCRVEDDESWDRASLTPEPDEQIPLEPTIRLVQTTLRVTYAVGTDVPVELAAGKPPENLPPEQVEQMIRQMTDWFDGSMFAEWQPLFEGIVAAGVPLRGRLRSVRIEEAKQPENRVVVLDASDLVYRLNPAPGGTFSNEELAAIFPGVLAGLPARMNSTISEYRGLPADGEALALEFYRERWVPRWMRRIRELLGKPVKLELDWARAADATLTAAQLPLWGLNRAYGGLAYACLDPARKEQLKRELDTVELAVGASVTRRFARYDDGKLSVGICYQGGDTPGCYEHEIARALAGNAFEP